MVPFCDGVAVFAHADLGYLRAAADGKVGVPNVSGTTGGITLTPGAAAGYVETFNSVGQRQGRAMFLNGTALQFDAQGAATSFQFLDPVSCTSSITSSGGGIGYATGAGGAATQATSKSNAVTLNTLTGQITTTADSMAANTITVFQVNNSNVAATDVVIVNIGSGPASASAYRASVTVVQNGLFKIMLENRSAGALAEALTLNFAVIKAVTA
jgi:hypothetical protein